MPLNIEEGHRVSEPISKLKNVINTLYALFNMKIMSHLEINACKLKPDQNEDVFQFNESSDLHLS
jgi:succinyl-CoA synthetase beta subunit